MPTSLTARRRALAPPRLTRGAGALAATAAALVLLPASLTPATAHADEKPGGAPQQPKPPAKASSVGGARLGLPGTQVSPKTGADAPDLPKGITARSWIVSDAETGQVLASHNAHWKLAPASTLKMLFADTVLPKFPKEKSHTVAAQDLAGIGEGSSLVGIKEGETYTVHDLWRGVFLRSGNDAVHVLSAMNGGVDKTVAEMNQHAKELRALDTHVVTPDGYDEKGQVSSAYDLTLFARSGLQKSDFREYASTATAKFPGATKKTKDGKEKREEFEIQNTNRLLTGDFGLEPYPGIAGVKNGSTTNAGNTFTGVAQRGDRVLLVTCMHPEGGGLEVYKETAKLFDWGFKAASRVQPVGSLVAPLGKGGTPSGSGHEGDRAGGKLTGAATEEESSGGGGVALGLTGAALVVVAGVAYAVHRRWPSPAGGRRRRRGRPKD